MQYSAEKKLKLCHQEQFVLLRSITCSVFVCRKQRLLARGSAKYLSIFAKSLSIPQIIADKDTRLETDRHLEILSENLRIL
jgi:hypothetical protein